MAKFQRAADDKSTRLDKEAATLLLMLKEQVKIELAGAQSFGLTLAVDADDATIAEVSEAPMGAGANPSNPAYTVAAKKTGTTRVTARVLNKSFSDAKEQRRAWQVSPVVAVLQVNVLGDEYRQAGGGWGDLTYGSTNPQWKNVKWSTMAEGGCGPTSLATALDYLQRLTQQNSSGSGANPGVTPIDTMKYASANGRRADNGVANGTVGPVMMSNIQSRWPQFTSRPVISLDDARSLLLQRKPIVSGASGGVVTFKYDEKGRKVEQPWDGHFMVVIGFESKGDTFWIADSSRFQGKFITASELSKCRMWVVQPAPIIESAGTVCKAENQTVSAPKAPASPLSLSP